MDVSILPDLDPGTGPPATSLLLEDVADVKPVFLNQEDDSSNRNLYVQHGPGQSWTSDIIANIQVSIYHIDNVLSNTCLHSSILSLNS